MSCFGLDHYSVCLTLINDGISRFCYLRVCTPYEPPIHSIPTRNRHTSFTSVVNRREEAKDTEAVESQKLVASERRFRVRDAVESQKNPNTIVPRR